MLALAVNLRAVWHAPAIGETGRAMHGWTRLLGVLMRKPIVMMRDAFNPRRAGYGKYFGRCSGTARVSERRNMPAANSTPFPDDESKARLFWARLLILDSIAR